MKTAAVQGLADAIRDLAPGWAESSTPDGTHTWTDHDIDRSITVAGRTVVGTSTSERHQTTCEVHLPEPVGQDAVTRAVQALQTAGVLPTADPTEEITAAERDRLANELTRFARIAQDQLSLDGFNMLNNVVPAALRGDLDAFPAAHRPMIARIAGCTAGRRTWFDEFLNVLDGVTCQFWVCPVEGHGQGTWAPKPTQTVEWRGNVAHCLAPNCGRTSQHTDT